MNFVAALRVIAEVIQNPTSNITVAVLLLAVVLILVLVAIIAILLFMQGPPRARTTRRRRPGAPPRRPRRVPKAPAARAEPEGSTVTLGQRVQAWMAGPTALVMVALLVFLALAVGYTSTSREDYCARTCHQRGASVQARAKDVHRKVTCVSCHERPGVAGVVDALANRPVHAFENLFRTPTYEDPVSTEACLGCHSNVLGAIVDKKSLGVRMSHKEPLAAGMVCMDCHIRPGHSETTATIGMTGCTRCHGTKKVSGKCVYCHVGDTSRALRRTAFTERLFPRIRLAPVKDCGGCHSQKKCDRCHGLRLPHSARFLSWEHARFSAFGKRKLCERCHPRSDCTYKCHDDFEPAHSSQYWVNAHRTLPRSSACSCHWYKLPDEGKAKGSFCAVCH